MDEVKFKSDFGGATQSNKLIDFKLSAKASPNPPADDFQEINTLNYRNKFTASPVLYWGTKNDYPQQIAAAMTQCDTLLAALFVSKGIYLGKGLYMYQEDYQNGREIIEMPMPAEIDDAFYASNIEEYIDFGIQEMNTWGQFFPVWRMSRAAKIAELRIYPTLFNRLERPSWQTGKIENVYVSAQWGVNNFVISSPIIPKDMREWVSKFPLIDNFNPVKQLQDNAAKKIWTTVQHIKNTVSGDHYGSVPWHAAYENGWVEMSSRVPEMKSKIYENIMNLANIIYIDSQYLHDQYPEWKDMNDDVKNTIIKKIQDDIDKNLTGSQNQGKSLFSTKWTNADGKTIYKVEIKPMESPFKDGQLLQDVQLADYHILSAVMLDPSLMGAIVPGGGKQSAGSGSNIREALQATIARADMIRRKVLSPLQTWLRYEGWDKKYAQTGAAAKNLGPIKFGIRDFVIPTQSGATMNSVKEVTN